MMTFPYTINSIYENDELLVLSKPSGLVVHSDGRTEEPTLVDWLLKQYPAIKNVGEPWKRDDGTTILRPGIVHRLDRQTSGVLVVAKTQDTFLHLKEQFQERKVVKEYRMFVYGVLKEQSGTIERPIGKSSKDFRLWSAQPGARGALRDARTDYTVLEQGEETAYVRVFPKTGRTHQIRVHFKAVHHPVVCDKRYAPKHECILGFKRLALHAFSLSFSTPTGKRLKVEAALPEDFRNALALL